MWNDVKERIAQWSPEENVVLFGLFLLIGLLLFRWLFLRSGVRAIKTLGPQPYREVRRLYAARSLLGWFFFTLGATLLEVYVLYPHWMPRIFTWKRVMNGTVMFLLIGVFFHLSALVKALTRYITTRGEREGQF